ncbi:Molybdopterin molybdenumtransferase [Paenibacillus solanacearum]|uniref:Molybdopterin molybdenumtransferase n=1 Tax=Paenibacillus solanacearum TaxID=2048548 RepID=A0A916NR01_9BACL|nr:gephyrin-like molybdotransferase Glp [Paenibacillus solanacearum]CAG7643739.1 Molybdopterin molybdenumtransferase [Paenibacillus solanacearum]
MKWNRQAMDVGEAQQRLLSHVRLQSSECLELRHAFGRRLAEDIIAAHDVPHFVKSGVDGFAVKSDDVRGAGIDNNPVLLEVIQTIPCGTIPTLPIGQGQASRIMTGAPLPVGADTVVMFEMTEDREIGGKRFVAVMKEQEPRRNISFIGEEMKENEYLFGTGQRINAGEASLLAAFGYEKVNVFEKIKVAIFTTGSELLDIGSPLQPGKIRNSNLYLLTCLVQEAGGEVVHFAMLPDQIEQAKKTIYDVIDAVDLIITSGGVSVGDYDIMADFFNELEGTLFFNKIAMRPGSVTTAGVSRNTLLFGLSGNPGACFVGFKLFVLPVMYAMHGKKDPYPHKFRAYLKGDFTKGNVFTRYVRGRSFIQDGRVFVEPVGKDQSSVSLSIKDSDCLIMIPPGGRGKQDGDFVEVMKL